MPLRVVAGVILYLVAIVTPVSWLYVKYGPSTPVDAGSAVDMAALAGTTAVGFMLGLCASKISDGGNSSLIDGFADVARGLRRAAGDGGPKRRAQGGT